MPLYDFKCLDCGEQFEALVLKSEPACPACQGQQPGTTDLDVQRRLRQHPAEQHQFGAQGQARRWRATKPSPIRKRSSITTTESAQRTFAALNPNRIVVTCRTCAKDVPESSRFCLSCGAALNGGAPLVTQTVAAPSSTPPRGPHAFTVALSSSSSGSLAEGRFLPGALLADRYRIVALLGRGGMGEVYRAHDLTLGQEVALKFLPEAAARNPAALARFYNEVRIARQVSHANVCRVYDLGEVDGQPYLSMEYVDGEDLGSLLRRIGRLPSDKAVEIARQLCAGLAAAHAKGVLHRDLKPANVMLNGRGHVVVTDFGLAALADEIPGEEIRNGTPAYMAPEQLAGREVTVQSDIYSLGLVLYEVFTGKRAFEASTLAELVRLHSETTPAQPVLAGEGTRSGGRERHSSLPRSRAFPSSLVRSRRCRESSRRRSIGRRARRR